jgi:hypothetical protein
MSVLSDLTDAITGVSNKNAQGDLEAALANIQAIQTPTAQQLQLSPLAEYTNAADLEAALSDAAQAGPSAYDTEKIDQTPIKVMQQALAQEGEIANAQGMTPQEKASIAAAEQEANRATAGQRGSIAQEFAGRGIPQSLIAAALENGTAGQNSEQMYQSALQAQGQAANQGITALQNEGTLASTLYGQEAGQANTVAAAQNALNQFNAANTQQTNLANQNTKQAANTYNATNAQDVSNKNTTSKQTVQEQNQVGAPTQAAQLALQKGAEETGVSEAMAGQQTAAGQQSAGLFGGLLGAGATLGSGAMMSNAIAAADGGEIPPKPTIPPTAFLKGGSVPGQSKVDGDSQVNDTVPARLSPGEYVLPRSVAQQPGVKNLLGRLNPSKPPAGAHPSDIKSILRALGELRAGV